MAALITIEGGIKGSYHDALPGASLKIILFPGENLDVAGAEMMAVIRRMLHNGRFELAGRRLRGGKMFGVALSGRPTRLTDVAVFTWLAIDTSAVVVIDYAVGVEPLYFVFGVNKMFPKCAAGLDGGSNANLTHITFERFGHAGIVWKHYMPFALLAVVVKHASTTTVQSPSTDNICHFG